MQTFIYEAHDGTGNKIKAEVEAENEQAAAKLLLSKGMTPTNIRAKRNLTSKLQKIPTKDKVLFSRQLSTLINAGLPLVQSLHSVNDQTANKALKEIISKITIDVESGISFSKSLAKFPKIFNTIFVTMVEASEASGTLDTGLERLANQQEKDADMASKIKGAMTYPVIVLFVMLGVVLFLVVKVLPQVQSIYASLPGVNLPILTRILLDLSHFLINDWWAAILIVIAMVYVFRKLAKTQQGRSLIDRYKMRGWPAGRLFMKMYMARFSRTASTLIASGVPLLQVMDIAARSINNVHIADSLQKAVVKVKSGRSIADSIAGDPNFLVLVPNMLRIGEESGALETMMSKVADYYEKEVDNEISAISSLIEPVLMVVMGGIALVIVAAILLPIYGLVNQSGFTQNG